MITTRARTLVTLLLSAALAGCSASTTASTTVSTTASIAPSTSAAGPTSSAGTVAAPPDTATPGPTRGGTAAPGAVTDVRDVTIAVDEPGDGHLVFDAIAAGDPAAAHDGKLVLLLHGFPESDESWREQLPALAATGYYAVAPNQRGYSPGARPAGVESYGIVKLIGDVFAMADALGAPRFHLVGHDWGAGVAWVAAAAKPDRVRSLTVLSIPHPDAFAAAFDAPDGEQARKSGYVQVFTAPGSVQRFLANDAAGLRLLYGGDVPKDKVDAYVRVLGTEPALDAALNWYRATDFHHHPSIGAVHVPTLFVWGTDDLAVSRDGAEATKSYVDGPYRFEELPGVSHWIPEAQPDEVRDLLAQELASVP